MKTHSSDRLRKHSCTPIVLLGAALGMTSAIQASVIVTTDPSVIAAFKAGATVENFDNLTATSITSYSPVILNSTTTTFSTRDAANTPTYDTGGATPTNPAGNPGAPVAVLAPSGGIAGDVASPNNVVGPALPSDFGAPRTPPLTALGANFMEVAMPAGKDAIKIGLFVTSGTVLVQIQDTNLQTLESTTVSAGSFVGFTRNTADIRNVSIVSTTPSLTIDDFTYAFTASTGGGGGGGGGGSSVPETGSAINLALAVSLLGFIRWKFRANHA